MFDQLVTYGSIYSVVIPLFIGILLWKRLSRREKYFVLFLFLAFGVDQSTYVFDHSNPILNLYKLSETLFYGYLMGGITGKRFWMQFSVIFYGITVLIFAYLYFYDPAYRNLLNFNPNFTMYSALSMVFWSGLAMYCLSISGVELLVSSSFWICLGVIFYSACSYFLFSFVDNVVLREQIWSLHNVINILTNLIFGLGLYQRKKESV